MLSLASHQKSVKRIKNLLKYLLFAKLNFRTKGCPKKNAIFYTKALRKVIKKCDESDFFFSSLFGILLGEMSFSKVTSTSKKLIFGIQEYNVKT